MKTIIIGDIHGCAAELGALLAKLAIGEDDQLVLLGDLFDRGPDSWEVFQIVRGLADTLGERFTLLRGNHEDYLLQGQLSLGQRLIWERVGRGATVRSFKAHGERMEDAAPWLREHCQLFWRQGDLQCVHAGIMVDPIEMNDMQTLIHDHDTVLRNRYAGPLTVTGHIALDTPVWFVGDCATVRHLPCGPWQPLPRQGVICIDTGCGKGGTLTAMIVEGAQYRLEQAEEDL